MKKFLVAVVAVLISIAAFSQGQYYDFTWRTSKFDGVQMQPIVESNRIIYNQRRAVIYNVSQTTVSEPYDFLRTATEGDYMWHVYGGQHGSVLFVCVYGTHAIIFEGWMYDKTWRTESVLTRDIPSYE
jgi:hypothetical protein